MTLDASRASEEAARAAAERAAFEESAEAVRETLEQKVRDLHDRAEEYLAESRAIAAARDALREIARARASSLEAAGAAAGADLASARRRYVEAARAHGEGQAGAARLCLARLRFCKQALEETRRKRAEASALGVRGAARRERFAESAASSGSKEASESLEDARGSEGATTAFDETDWSREGPDGSSVSADLRASQRSIERAYVEAEEGARAVFAAAEASRREATAIAPAAAAAKESEGAVANPRQGDPPFFLSAVFAAVDEARAAFAAEAATRPALEIEQTPSAHRVTDTLAAPTKENSKGNSAKTDTLSETDAFSADVPEKDRSRDGDATQSVTSPETEPLPLVAPRDEDPDPASSTNAALPPAEEAPNAAEAANDDVDDWLAET